jgi:hypothetical protein
MTLSRALRELVAGGRDAETCATIADFPARPELD